MVKNNLIIIMTFLRFVLIPFFVVFILMDDIYAKVAALLIFIADCILNFSGNHIASHFQYDMKAREIISVLIDKLLISAAFICFAGMKELAIPAWMVILIVINEFVTSGLKNIVAPGKEKISIKINPKTRVVSKSGIMVIIVILVIIGALKNNPQILFTGTAKLLLKAIPYWITLIIAGFGAASGINCVRRNIKMLQEGKSDG